MSLRLFNTLGREMQKFVPIDDKKVGMYTCGPTVYQYAHIGNLRSYVFEDELRRALEYFGYEVRHVMNVTDVGHLTDDADEGEDKVIKSAREMGKTVWDIAEHFTDAFFTDVEKLNIEQPTVVCRATDHIDDMIEMIRRIEANGYTYEAGGNIYFDTSKFPNYGELALLDRQEQRAGARIEVDENKKHPRDFVLWFTKSKFENQAMIWDSPWGRGYPGWHIECSAMSTQYLGEHFDIHTGGVDHIPVHHTNEIAQTEAATGHTWVNYWIHGEFLLMDTGKMSKSKGNFVTLGVLEEEGFEPLDFRFLCLGGHYRTQLQFSYDALNAARQSRRNLLDRIAAIKEAAGAGGEGADAGDGGGRFADASTGDAGAETRLGERAAAWLSGFEEHLGDDLNVPKCLADLWGVVKDDALTPGEKLDLVARMDGIFALDLLEAQASTDTSLLEDDIRKLVEERTEARKNRNFARADEIRDMLAERGIILEDTPEGTRWKKL
ncbi:MAG: cysteine--tRNA ligase [Spirochaetes bacterium]|nr:cysteine--tRNA ligase [Spirochaetota bacterium]